MVRRNLSFQFSSALIAALGLGFGFGGCTSDAAPVAKGQFSTLEGTDCSPIADALNPRIEVAVADWLKRGGKKPIQKLLAAQLRTEKDFPELGGTLAQFSGLESPLENFNAYWVEWAAWKVDDVVRLEETTMVDLLNTTPESSSEGIQLMRGTPKSGALVPTRDARNYALRLEFTNENTFDYATQGFAYWVRMIRTGEGWKVGDWTLQTVVEKIWDPQGFGETFPVAVCTKNYPSSSEGSINISLGSYTRARFHGLTVEIGQMDLHAPIEAGGLHVLAQLPAAKDFLTDVSNDARASDAMLTAWGTRLDAVRSVTLFSGAVTSEGVRGLVEHGPAFLETLQLTVEYELTYADLVFLVEHAPQLDNLSVKAVADGDKILIDKYIEAKRETGRRIRVGVDSDQD